MSATHIAVVDDEIDITQLIARYLGAMGFRVTHLHRGTDLLSLMQSDPPALVLLDLGLPGMSGFEVLRALRSPPRTRLLPVIVFWATDEQIDVRRAMQMGATSYIRKSLDAVRLTENLELLARYWLGLNVPPPVPNHKS